MMVEEMTDVTFHKSMLILQEAMRASVKTIFHATEKQIQAVLADWECKIVCVNRYCMNLLYAPYWGKQR